MDTTDLFDFSFVDRERERQLFNNFMANSDKNVLWVDGGRGVGKTQFISYMTEQNTDFEFVYYDIKAENKDTQILTEFIEVLQSFSNISFFKFVQKEYSQFYDNCGSSLKYMTQNILPSISNLVTIIWDLTNYVVTKQNERKESIDIIKDYINSIIGNKKLLICIDDFSRCNKYLATIFFNIFKHFISNSNCKISIITTIDDMNDQKKLHIRESIPYFFINLNGFENCKFFYQILEPIFYNKFSIDDIKYIYQKCEGKPQKLSVIISKLLDKNGIEWSEKRKKAKINKNILQGLLREEYIKYNKDDFDVKQQWILFSFLCLYESVSIQNVKNLALYIAKKNIIFFAFNEEIFHNELLKLIQHNQLKTDGELLYTCHDSDYIDFMDIFLGSNMKQIFSQNTYEFLMQDSALSDREDLLCRHMRIAAISGWKEKNFIYGNSLYRKHQFSDAQKIFEYLLKEQESLDENWLLVIALNTYELGDFETTINIVENIKFDKLQDPSDMFNLYFHWGKSIYNYTGNITDAISKLERATSFISPDSKEFVNVQNILQMYYIEIPGKKEKAMQIFSDIRSKYKELYPELWASTMRGCHNFISNNDNALKLLNEAKNVTHDEIECAYIETTVGFVYIRMGDIQNAQNYFESSYEKLRSIKCHESSYAANNLAACYMMNGNYQKGKEILEDALFWNKTNYGKIVICVHLMICECFLKNKKSILKYYDFLKDYVASSNLIDPIVLRKVNLNLAVASKTLGYDLMHEKYLKQAEKFVKNSSSEWRYSVMTQNVTQTSPQNLYYRFSLFDPWFLVYAHD